MDASSPVSSEPESAAEPAPTPRRGIRLANAITLSRIFLAPFFVWAFLEGHIGHSRTAQWLALAIALSFELTDAFDGWVARARHEVSDFGKIVDPVADQISRFTVFVCFLVAGYANLWAVLIIFWREAIVSFLRIIAGQKGVVLAARPFGKAKAICQAVAINAILIFGLVPVFPPGGSGWVLWRVDDAAHHHEIARLLVWGVAVVTAVSLVDYLHANRKVLRELDI